jgi:hypothetical protein
MTCSRYVIVVSVVMWERSTPLFGREPAGRTNGANRTGGISYAGTIDPPSDGGSVGHRPRACFWCYGTGRVPNDYHEHYDRCETCGGTGVRPTSLAVRLHGRPAIEIVATAA